jgi:hypothetical protein
MRAERVGRGIHEYTFLCAIDVIITEMDHRFNEVTSELLVCFFLS